MSTQRLAVTILPFYLLTGALATNTRAEIIWGNMTYFANGNAGLARNSQQYTGLYSFNVVPVVTAGSVTGLQLTELSGPYAPDVGHYTTIPATAPGNGNIITFNAMNVQEYAPPPPGGQFPRRTGMNDIEGTYYPGFLSFQLTRVGSKFPGTYWRFQSTPCMPEPRTDIILVIGSAGTIAYGWRRRREQRRQRPVGPPEAIV